MTSGANDDRFNEVFGSMANQARAVIDADIAYWQRVITNFNYSDGTDTYNLTVTMNTTAQSGGLGANTLVTSTIGGKPSAATISVGWQSLAASGDSDAGWYLDPTPMNNGEFQGTIYNAFDEAPTTTLSGGGFDMLPGLMHEIGHAMGLYASSAMKALAVDTGVIDTLDAPASNPPSHYFSINQTNVKTLWTGYDGGGASGGASNQNGPQHAAPSGATVTSGGITYYGEVDMMKPYWTQRATISNNDAYLLTDAYRYNIALPSIFGTSYDELDSSGVLRITGTSGNDTISVEPSGTNFAVTMTLGSPVAGIDPTGSFTSTFAQSAVKGISVSSLGGDDTITVPVATFGESVVVDGGTGTNHVTIDDSNSSFANPVYNVTNLSITKTKAGSTTLSNVQSLQLNTGTSASSVYVRTTSVPTTIQGQTTSAVIVGTGSVQSINGALTILNPPSASQVTIDDSSDTAAKYPTISDGSIIGLAPAAISWDPTDINALTIEGGTGGNGFFVANTNNYYTTNLLTGSGNDNVDFQNGSTNASGAISIDGQGGTNAVYLYDPANATQTYTMTSTGFSRTGLTVTEANFSSNYFGTGPAADTFNVNGNPVSASLQFDLGGGNDTLNLNQGTFSIYGNMGASSPTLTVNIATAVNVNFTTYESISTLNLLGTAKATMPLTGPTDLITKSLSIASTSTLDLENSDLIVDYTGTSPRAAIQSLVKAARNGGAWNGAGILSTNAKNNTQHNTTLALVEATDYQSANGGVKTFDGIPIDTTAVLVKYTYYGDTDFNGKINANDYGRIDAGYQTQHNSGFAADWFNGDFNYDGVIDANDYALIDAAYQTQTAGAVLPSITGTSSISTRSGGLIGFAGGTFSDGGAALIGSE